MRHHDLGHAPVQDLNWLITNFVEQVPSAAHAIVMAISDGSSLAVLAAADCDTGLVAYEMTLMVERVGSALTPAMRGAQTSG